MGFVNEYVSHEDVEKYGLAEVRFQFQPLDRERPDSIVYKWTIDRSRDVYLMRYGTGAGETGNRMYWVLSVRGRLIEFDTDVVAVGSSSSLEARPFKLEYALVRMHPMPDREDERAELLALLKEALTVYGFAGPQWQIPETVVSFRF